MRGFRSRMLRTLAASSFFTAATSSASSVIVSALGGGSMGPASKNLALYVATWVSPHDGHMTSIGRLLVVISIGFPQRGHAIDIGAEAGAWTGPAPGGGRAALGPNRLPPPVRRHSPRTATSSRRNRRPRTTA